MFFGKFRNILRQPMTFQKFSFKSEHFGMALGALHFGVSNIGQMREDAQRLDEGFARLSATAHGKGENRPGAPRQQRP